MEMYFSPEEGAVADEAGILAALRKAGLAPGTEQEGEARIVAFPGSGVFVSFQVREGVFTFATLDIPMAEQDLGHTVFCALEDLGWVSHEDVG